jgi:fructan beta-fructosidase
MSLAAGDKILFFSSPDLKNWELTGTFGSGYGCTDGVWETPDLFKLPVEGSDESRWVLTVGVGSGAPAGGTGTQYFIGEFDGTNFVSENSRETTLWTDFGADYYAPQSWNEEPDARRLMIGWMNNWQYARLIPAGEWRGAFSLIRELSLKQTEAGIRLFQQPVPELQNLRSTHTHRGAETIQPGSNILADLHGSSLEILAEFQFEGDVELFGFRLRVGANEQTTVGYDPKERRIFVDRTRSGSVDFHEGFARIHSAALDPSDNKIRLHIFVDSSSVEVFANDGLMTFAECIFPAADSQGLELIVEGGNILLYSMDVFQLQPASIQTKEM